MQVVHAAGVVNLQFVSQYGLDVRDRNLSWQRSIFAPTNQEIFETENRDDARRTSNDHGTQGSDEQVCCAANGDAAGKSSVLDVRLK